MDKKLKIRIFLRSFLIQAGWNYERFQNIGFYLSIYPALEKIWKDKPAEFKKSLLRHFSTFNTQPFFVGFILGNAWKMEEKLSAEPSETLEKNISNVKQALACSFASIGDRIFWGRLKPITTQICITVWILTGYTGWLITSESRRWLSDASLLAGPLAGILIYSVFAVYLRWRGISIGYDCGGISSCGLETANWSRIIKHLSAAGFILSAFLILFSVFALVSTAANTAGPAGIIYNMFPPLAVFLLHRIVRRFQKSIFYAIGAILLVSIAWSMAAGM
ncbi:MAG: PTS system mannose/fructose/sorbose family transporter subunit IID [Elusimicrobia bacterium]|nr:PTS system mannose/fructose/sorbose family transporter subunit IID [Elusimicrobiota bacterium]